MQAKLVGLGLDQVAQLMGDGVVCLLSGIPQESLIQNGHLRDIVCQHRVCAGCNIEVALNGHIQTVTLAAQRTTSLNRHGDLAVGRFFHALCDLQSALIVVGRGVVLQGHGQLYCTTCRCTGRSGTIAAATGRQSGSGAQNTGSLQEGTAGNRSFHDVSPFSSLCGICYSVSRLVRRTSCDVIRHSLTKI